MRIDELYGNVEVDIKMEGEESAIIYAPFDQAIKTLKSYGHWVISLEEEARLRIQQGADSPVSTITNRVREGMIYIPKAKNNSKMVRNSPILRFPEDARRAHMKRSEFYITDDMIDEALEDSVDFPSQTISIPTNRLDENEFTYWAFGGEQNARAYGEFLRQSDIRDMLCWVSNPEYVNSKQRPFAKQVLFSKIKPPKKDLPYEELSIPFFHEKMSSANFINQINMKTGMFNLERVILERDMKHIKFGQPYPSITAYDLQLHFHIPVRGISIRKLINTPSVSNE